MDPVNPNNPPPDEASAQTMPICTGCGRMAHKDAGPCATCEQPLDGAPQVPRLVRRNAYWVGVRCRFTCRVCGHPSPLNHLDTSGSVLCLRCGVDQTFDVNQWQQAIAHAHAVGDLSGPEPHGRFPLSEGQVLRNNPHAGIGVKAPFAADQQQGSTLSAAGLNVRSLRLEAAPGRPLCGACRGLLELAEEGPGHVDLRCVRCDRTEHYDRPRRIPKRLLGVVAPEHAVQGEEVHVERHESGAVAVRCPSCASPLAVDPSSTVVTCQACGVGSRIPGHTLRTLGLPPPVERVWWMLFRGASEMRQRQARKRGNKRRQGQVQGGNLREKKAPPPPPSLGRRLLGLLPMLLLASVISLVLLVTSAYAFWLAYDEWQLASADVETTCTVVSAEIRETGGESTSYQREVRVAHQVDGQRFERTHRFGHDLSRASAVQRLPRVGSTVPCRYLAGNPAVVTQFPPSETYGIQAAMGVIPLVTIPILWVILLGGAVKRMRG